jgi:Leucine-rich repeat (LRR) protein
MHLSYSLADVQLHCNKLVALDSSLFAATSITSLRLDSNRIVALPDDVASASSLQVIFIRVYAAIKILTES